MRLRSKAILGIAGLLVATIVVLSLGSSRLMHRALREEVERRGHELVAHLASAAEYPVFVGDREGLKEIIAQNSDRMDLVYIHFEDASGNLLAAGHGSASWHAAQAGQPAPFARPAGGEPVGALDRAGDPEVVELAQEVLLARQPDALGIAEGRRESGAARAIGRVRVGMSYHRVSEVASRINRALAGMALPVAVVGVMLALVLAGGVVFPLQELARGLEEVCVGSFGREVQVRGRDEVAQLATSFNHMLRDVRTYRDEVDRVHNNLESLVSRRTHELEEVNRELAAASRTKSEFLANVSHELRTPLNAILGFISLVIDGHCANPEEEKELLGDAQQGARHLLSLINSILDLAKIETGKMGAQLCEVRVQEVLGEVRSIVRSQADLKGLELTFQAGGSDGPSVLADPGKLKQVLVNLTGNAIKFTEKGCVSVLAEVCAEKGHVRFEVRDTGIGIPPDKHHLLFNKFQQLDGSHTRRYSGTGLGLAISKALVEMMAGTIWMTSPGEGKGTTVAFTIPLFRGLEELVSVAGGEGYSSSELRRADPDRSEAPAPLPEREGPLALVVEDDPACRLVLKEIFTLSGYRVIEASTADEALLRARQARPRVVTIDLGLPAAKGAHLVDGCDLMAALERDPDTRNATLALISGQEPHVVRDRMRRENLRGSAQVFGKPVDAREVLAWAESVLSAGAPAPV